MYNTGLQKEYQNKEASEVLICNVSKSNLLVIIKNSEIHSTSSKYVAKYQIQ